MIREKKLKRSRVALAITRKTGRPVGLDTATHLEMDADFSVREDRTTPEHEPFEETDPLYELMGIMSGLQA